MFWFWMWVIAIVVIAIVVIRGAMKKRAVVVLPVSEPAIVNPAAGLIRALGGNSYRNSYFYPETWDELVEEFNRHASENKRVDAEFRGNIDPLYADWKAKKAAVPIYDGTSETEERRRLALRAVTEVGRRLDDVVERWELVKGCRKTVEQLVEDAERKDVARALEEGTVIHSAFARHSFDINHLRQIVRLSNGRYILFAFRAGFLNGDEDPTVKGEVEKLSFRQESVGQFSGEEVVAVNADKRSRMAQPSP